MAAPTNRHFPPSLVPGSLGIRVLERRQEKGWSRERLARACGIDRRTVLRVEKSEHVPGPRVVHALEEALDLVSLVPGWGEPLPPNSPSYGPRARMARAAAGLTLRQVADMAGISPATLSRFEREMDATTLIITAGEAGRWLTNDRYARSLGFSDGRDMDDYCMSADPTPWLAAIARAVLI